jgi:hypothetical protein
MLLTEQLATLIKWLDGLNTFIGNWGSLPDDPLFG